VLYLDCIPKTKIQTPSFDQTTPDLSSVTEAKPTIGLIYLSVEAKLSRQSMGLLLFSLTCRSLVFPVYFGFISPHSNRDIFNSILARSSSYCLIAITNNPFFTPAPVPLLPYSSISKPLRVKDATILPLYLSLTEIQPRRRLVCQNIEPTRQRNFPL